MNLAMVAVQLGIDADVLASPEAYRKHLEIAAGGAADATVGADARLFVFPELAGHLALLALAPPAARKAKTLSRALATSAVRRPLDVLRGVATSRLLNPRAAVLAALAPDGERYWRSVFAPLARRHDAYVVAGSHLQLTAAGDVTNTSFTYAPDGRCLAATDKVNLVPGMEDAAPGALGLARGHADALPVVETPFGVLATLVCYDAFAEPHTATERFTALAQRLAGRGVAVVANPAANPWPWLGKWPPASMANGVDRGAGTREAQWRREGLAASMRGGFARLGITAHLVGSVLDLRFEGASEILEHAGGDVRVLARAGYHDRADHVVARVTC